MIKKSHRANKIIYVCMYYELLPSFKWHTETIYSTFDNQYNKILKIDKSFRAALTEPFKYKCIMNYFSNLICSFWFVYTFTVVFKSSLVNLN